MPRFMRSRAAQAGAQRVVSERSRRSGAWTVSGAQRVVIRSPQVTKAARALYEKERGGVGTEPSGETPDCTITLDV